MPQATVRYLCLVAVAACGYTTPGPPGPVCTVTAVSVTGAPAVVHVGNEVQLAAIVTSTDCDEAPVVTWSSSREDIVTIDADGLATAVAAGSATVQATAQGTSGQVTLTVEVVPVASVRISPDSLVAPAGVTLMLRAEALDAAGAVLTGRTVAWLSDNGLGAQVSGEGEVFTVNPGQRAVITATVEGRSASTVIHVVRRRLAYLHSEATPGPAPVPPASGQSFNSLGGVNLVSSSADGVYRVEFPAQQRQGMEKELILVGSHGTILNAWCNQGTWTNLSLDIDCLAGGGWNWPVPWQAVLVASGSFTGRWGFATFTPPNPVIDADPEHRFSSSGGAITAERIFGGSYRVRFAGLGRNLQPGSEAVFVVGRQTLGACLPAGWEAGGDDLVIIVNCHSFHLPLESAFSVLVLDGPRPGARSAVVYADQPNTASYQPMNSAVKPSGTVTVQRIDVGRYRVQLDGFHRTGASREAFLVSAVDEVLTYCEVISWTPAVDSGSPTIVEIGCGDRFGNAIDSRFSLLGIQ
jgi:hypothetical protein